MTFRRCYRQAIAKRHALRSITNTFASLASAAYQTLILFRASGCKSLGVVELSGVRPPPAMVRLTPRAELVEEYRARFFGQPAGVVIEEGHSRQIETGEEKTRIVEVVTKEPELQRRVREKRERLAAKVAANMSKMMFLSKRLCFVLFFLWITHTSVGDVPRVRLDKKYTLGRFSTCDNGRHVESITINTFSGLSYSRLSR